MRRYEIECLANHTADDVLAASAGMIKMMIMREGDSIKECLDHVINDQNALLFMEKTDGSI